MVRINGLVITYLYYGIYWGEITHYLLTIDPKFQRDIPVCGGNFFQRSLAEGTS